MTTPAPPAVRVLVVDDHPVVRAGLASIVATRPGWCVVGEAADGIQAVERHRGLAPDVVLMDLRMPVCDGVSAIEAIRAHDSAARIVILTAFDAEEDLRRGLRAGAMAYLLKDAAGRQLVECIDAVMQGRRYLAPSVEARLARRSLADALSRREREILDGLAEGLSNREVARREGITEGTVKFHVTAILSKLGARNRTEAVALAVQRGLVSLR